MYNCKSSSLLLTCSHFTSHFCSQFVNYIWESLVETLLIFIVLSYQLNVLSALAGISLTLAALPLQIYIAKLFSAMRSDTASQTDKRVRHMSEIVDGISSVKGYGWEQPFISMILGIRDKELSNVLRAQRLRAINYALYFCSPHVTAFAIFMVYYRLGGTLTLPLVFSTLAFIQTLRLGIGRFFTRAIETLSESYTSALRIENYLDLFEHVNDVQVQQSSDTLTQTNQPHSNPSQERHVKSDVQSDCVIESKNTSSNLLLEVKNGKFAHSSTSSAVLQNINFTLHRGEILMVVGAGNFL